MSSWLVDSDSINWLALSDLKIEKFRPAGAVQNAPPPVTFETEPLGAVTNDECEGDLLKKSEVE